MAYKLIKVMLDVTFPDGMVDDEAPAPPEGAPSTLATARSEAIRIIRDGASEDGFDFEAILNDGLTQIGGVGSDAHIDLEVQ